MLTNRDLIRELQRLPLDATASVLLYDRLNGWEYSKIAHVHYDAESTPNGVVLRAADPVEAEPASTFKYAGYYQLEVYSWTKQGNRLVHGVWSDTAPNETTARDRAICEYAAGTSYRLCARLISFVPDASACRGVLVH